MDHTPDDVQIDISGLWKDLQGLIRRVVEQMNYDEELRQRTGGLDFQQGPLDTIVVKKQSLPAVYLTLTRGTAVIAVNHRIVINGPNAKEREIAVNHRIVINDPNATEQEIRDSLSIEIVETRTPLHRTNQGESFTIEEVVFYILRPFLRPALLIS
jgi:hypothetical protein